MSGAWFLIYVALEWSRVQQQNLRTQNQSCLAPPLLLFPSNCSELSLTGPQSSPLYPFPCLLSSLSLKSFCLLSASISVTVMSKHISCVQGGFQRHQAVPPTWLSECRWKYLAEDTDTSPLWKKHSIKVGFNPWPVYSVRANRCRTIQ